MLELNSAHPQAKNVDGVGVQKWNISLLQCKGVDAVDAFFHQVFNPPTKLGIIGAGCSPSTQEAALVSQFYNITQVFSFFDDLW